jgi:hypothetical protein
VIDQAAAASRVSLKPPPEVSIMPPRRRRRLTRAAAALAVTALVTPTAGARRVEAISNPAPVTSPAPTVIRTIDSGFDWGAAALGAGAAAAIVLLSVAGVRARPRAGPSPVIRSRGAGDMHANSNRRVP